MLSTPTIFRSITLAPGESYVLPAGATIISATNSSAITSENGCAGDLTNLETLECYRFAFGKDTDNNTEHPMDDAALQSLIINGVSYDISTSIMSSANGSSLSWCPTVENKFSLNVPEIVQYLDCASTGCYGENIGTDKRCEYRLDVRTIPSIAENMEIYMTGKAFPNGLYIHPVKIDCPSST